jgi:glycosyltransferase involved in cell wall biosynthesis
VGLPVIATDVGTGTLEAFDDGQTGIAIPPDDARELVMAINDVLGDPERARAMGQAGRRFVEERYSLTSLATRLRPVYERLASRPQGMAAAKTRFSTRVSQASRRSDP